MRFDILTFIVLPNVGYWKGKEIVSKKDFSRAQKILTKITNEKRRCVYAVDTFIHREDDLPAIVWSDGSKEWWKYGRRHRKGDLPAIEWSFGCKQWYKNGIAYRKGGLPDIERIN